MKTLLKIVGALALLVALGAGGLFVWAKSAVASELAREPDAHTVDFPIPFPLTEAEIEQLRKERVEAAGTDARNDEAAGDDSAAAAAEEAPAADPLAGVDLDALALERARARGKHLVEARYACIECHGKNFGGGVMVDDPAMGQLLGPNLTTGSGSVTKDFGPADWDRIVRHGIRKNGRPAVMPSEDFQKMSNQELSDIVAYIRSQPPVDNEVPASSLGPVGTLLAAFGQLPLSVDIIKNHHAAHSALPPETSPTAEFGEHLAGICTGCHRAHFEGGPILAGPPDWPPARNITPHEQGLKGWSYEDFVAAMRQGRRPDGTSLREPMSLVLPYARSMTEVELQALWAYLSSREPVPTGT